MRTPFAVAALLLTTQTLADPPATGPFGFTQGMTLAEISKLGPVEKGPQPYVFHIKAAPKSHSEFEGYTLILTPQSGLCKVIAYGVTHKTNGYGIDLKSAFAKLETVLNERYGPSNKTDILFDGSIWKEPEDWMMGILKKERYLGARPRSTSAAPASVSRCHARLPRATLGWAESRSRGDTLLVQQGHVEVAAGGPDGGHLARDGGVEAQGAGAVREAACGAGSRRGAARGRL